MVGRCTLVLCVLLFFFFYYYSFQQKEENNAVSGIRTIRMKESIRYINNSNTNKKTNTVATNYLKDFGKYSKNRITRF